MAIEPGTRFGPYEIVDAIGAGGMGEVYRATDTKLGREVAIKTLPSAFAADTDRLARFEREAKLLAALNHPNIAVIYGLEESKGTQCIAMELIEGETLEEKLKDGPLPVEDALRLALQIAQALEAAHEKGVIHRDLKPANVMVTAKGQVKVLDFGLAKALSKDADQSNLGQSPALSLAMTQQGIVLGTASYMSPEQASGQATDQRADVWAFGVVLFEMLSGLPLFTGESVPHILADVLKTEPDWKRLPKDLDPRLKVLLDRCLRKKPHSRYHAIADSRIDIEDILNDPQGGEAVTATAQPLWRRALPVAAAVLVTGILVGLAGEMLRPEPSSESPASTSFAIQRHSFDLGIVGTLGQSGLTAEVAVSPDGSRVVYSANQPPAGIQLFVRALDQFEAQPIPGTQIAARSPIFSPDGEWIAFTSGMGARFNKISLRGGPPQTLTEDITRVYGGTWVDDSIVISTTDGVDLFAGYLARVPAAGGAPEMLTTPEPGTAHLEPRALPGGEAVLFTIRLLDGPASEGSIAVLSLETGEYQPLISQAFAASYTPTGHIIFARGSALWAVPFDPERLEIIGTETPIVEGVQTNGELGLAPYDFSDNGMLAYVRGGEVGGDGGATRGLVWVDREGREEPLDVDLDAYLYPRLSPDGQRLAVTIGNTPNQQDVWIYDLVRGAESRLTFDTTAASLRPVWTRDGQSVVYYSTRAESGIFRRAANGTGSEERLTSSDAQQLPEFFSPDGTQLIVRTNPQGSMDLYALSVEGEPRSTALLEMDYHEGYSAISPDGRWIAYLSDETGTYEVYVRPFPNVDDGRWQISTEGGVEPLWAPDGRELFYRNAGAVIVVAVDTESDFSAGPPEVLFTDDY